MNLTCSFMEMKPFTYLMSLRRLGHKVWERKWGCLPDQTYQGNCSVWSSRPCQPSKWVVVIETVTEPDKQMQNKGLLDKTYFSVLNDRQKSVIQWVQGTQLSGHLAWNLSVIHSTSIDHSQKSKLLTTVTPATDAWYPLDSLILVILGIETHSMRNDESDWNDCGFAF